MVQALLNSIKSMVGVQSSQNKEFKTEAVKNNRNVSAALKDIYKMFSVTKDSDSKNSVSLGNIEASSASTADKVDRSNALLQESISLQSQMISELRIMSKTIASLATNNNNTTLLNQQNQQNEPMGILQKTALGALGVGAIGAAGFAGATINDYFMGSTDKRNTSFAGSVEFSGDVKKVLQTIKTLESGGDYSTPNKSGSSTASGAYQFIDGTWKSLAQKYNIGTEYDRAMHAPPEIQDAVAGKYVEEILRQNNNDVSKIPLVWYTGNAQGNMSKEAMAANGGQAAQTYQSKWLNTYQNIEGDDSGAYPTGIAQPQNNAMGGSGGNVTEDQSRLAGIRRMPLNSRLKSVLQQAAAAAGVDVQVYSGGQPRQGEGGQRTGSTRHDHGNAADVYLYKEGRKLRDPEDREIMAKFVSAAASAGATGIGFGGPGQYMGESGIHVGFGKSATWGGSPWIASAAAGVFSNRDLQAENTDTSGNYASSYGGNIFGSLMGMGGGPLGEMTGLDNNIASLIAGFFGLPSLAGIGGSEGGNFGASQVSSVFDESTEEEPKEMMGRSSGPGGIMINSPEFGDFKKTTEKKKPKEGDFFNYEIDNLSSKIQSSAIEDKTNKVAVNSAKPYSQAPMSETPTDFGAVSGNRSSNDTRASWAPRMAVLRPDDDVTRSLTWAARIKGYA